VKRGSSFAATSRIGFEAGYFRLAAEYTLAKDKADILASK
jgi:hypothetical protein